MCAAYLVLVSLTSFMNAFIDPLYSAWRESVVRRLAGEPMGGLPQGLAISPQTALEAAYLVEPTSSVVSLVSPGGRDGAPGHYVVWVKDSAAVSPKVSHPILIHAQTGWINLSYPLPWYLKVLQLSQRLQSGVPAAVLWSVGVAAATCLLISGRRYRHGR